MLQKVNEFLNMNNHLHPQPTSSSNNTQVQQQQNESNIDLQNQMQAYTSLSGGYLPTEFYNSNKQESFEIYLPNGDNDPILLDKYNSPSAEQIRNINNQLLSNKADFSSLWNLWNQSDSKKVIEGFLFNVQPDNWKLLRYQCEKPLENFLNLCQSKITSTAYANQIYPGLVQLKKIIEKSIQAANIPKQIPDKEDEKKSDTLFEYYLREIQSKNKRQGAFYIKDDSGQRKIPIGEFIAKSDHSSSHAWKDIFFKATLLHDKKTEEKSMEQQQEKAQRQNKELIKAQILKNANCVFPPDNHICCSQFFYFNHKIYDQVISSCPLITERSFQKFIKGQHELTETIKDIVGLMNSGGGVIMFNTFKNYLEIQPKGEVILESQFQQAIRFITEQLKYICPSVLLNEQVFVNFVPVARNLFSQDSILEDTKNYIEGLYIMRIVVKPTDDAPEYLYYFSKEKDAKMLIVQNNKRKLIAPTQMHKIMKRRFNYYYIPEKDYADEEEKNMIKKSYSYFTNHSQCLTPQKGLPLKEKKVKITQESNNKQLQTKYKYLTLLVTNTTYHQIIEQRLKAKGIDCQILIKYNKYRFRAANNSAALFHNIKFNKLLEEVAYKKQFQFDQRYMLTILVTPFLKLMENKVPILEEYNTLQSWLKKEHSQQQLKVWRFSTDDNQSYEFYFQTECKLSTLFMYFLLTHYSMKCTFKNPNGYEKMSQDEKRKRLELWYPRPQQGK